MVSKVGVTPSMAEPWILSAFWSRKLKPKMPTAAALASSFCTIRLSFSPASTNTPSSRTVWQAAFLASPSSALISANSPQPLSMTSSTKASRVPEVGGGPSTSIAAFGSAGSISLQLL